MNIYTDTKLNRRENDATAPGRTALVVAVEEAASILGEVRTPPIGSLPPHITVISPFIPAAHLDAEAIGRLRVLLSAMEPFVFRLTTVKQLSSVLYLEPDRRSTFVALTHEVSRNFPQYPPYEGHHDGDMPHLTVTVGDPEELERTRKLLANRLPELKALRLSCSHLKLFGEFPQDWKEVQRIALSAGCARGTPERVTRTGRSSRWPPGRIFPWSTAR